MGSRRPNIWKLQSEQNLEGLIGALSYSDPEIRKRAAAALRIIGNAKAVVALENALVIEKNPYVRDHIKTALTFFSQESLLEDFIEKKNVDGLVDLLGSPRQAEVMSAIKALGEIGDRTATEGLVMVFRNQLMEDDIRLAAARALLKLENAPAVATLLGALDKDDWQVRHNAIIVLGQLRATWATKPIIKALRDPHSRVRKSAAWALKQMRSSEAAEELKAYQKREAKMQTSELEGIVDQPVKADTPEKPNKEQPESTPKREVGKADQNMVTKVRSAKEMSQMMEEALDEAEDNLSPAMAGAEAALASMSPDAEGLFKGKEAPSEKPETDQTSSEAKSESKSAPDDKSSDAPSSPKDSSKT